MLQLSLSLALTLALALALALALTLTLLEHNCSGPLVHPYFLNRALRSVEVAVRVRVTVGVLIRDL